MDLKTVNYKVKSILKSAYSVSLFYQDKRDNLPDTIEDHCHQTQQQAEILQRALHH